MEVDGNEENNSEESAADSDDSSSDDFKTFPISNSFRLMQVQNIDEHQTPLNVSSSSKDCSPERKKYRREGSEVSVAKVKMQFFNCKMCPKRFSLRAKLVSHMKSRHGVTESKKRKRASNADSAQIFPCTNCTKVFASKSGLYSHAVMHSAARKTMYCCPADTCGNKYYTVENFEKHIQNCHGNSELSFACSECENMRTFGSDVGAYTEHVQSEHDGKPRRQK